MPKQFQPKANTTAKAPFENVFVHYGFPSKINSDMGANFESKVIKKLCDIADIKKTRTTPIIQWEMTWWRDSTKLC